MPSTGSTHPSSPFVRTLTAQRATRDVRYVLRYPLYTEIRASGTGTREIARVELLALLRDVFLIELPADTMFPAIDSVSSHITAASTDRPPPGAGRLANQKR